MLSDSHTSSAQPSPLIQILNDLEAANVKPTPLGILARATDLGMTDAQISAVVDELAAQRRLDEVAA